jgi:hypothetical protein
VTAVVALLIYSNRNGDTQQTGPAHKKQNDTQQEPALASAITVEYEDGTRIGVASLQEAIRRASGRRAKVLLGGNAPIKLGSVAAQQLRVSSGGVIIQAAEGAKPILDIQISANAPAIVVSANSMLTLEGLTLRVERKLSDPSLAPAVIHSTGNLKLGRCVLMVKGSERRLRGVLFEGNQFTAESSFVHGFETPLAISGLAGIDVRLEHCIVCGFPEAGSSTVANAGWDVVFMLRATRRNAPRKLTLDHCTFSGTGLLRVEGPVDQASLQIEISHCVVSGQALAMWPVGAFPGAMNWRGVSNLYGLTGEWIVRAPGVARPETDPAGMPTWGKSATIKESDSQEAIVRFGVAANPQKPTDFKLAEPANAKAGADVERVAGVPEL